MTGIRSREMTIESNSVRGAMEKEEEKEEEEENSECESRRVVTGSERKGKGRRLKD